MDPKTEHPSAQKAVTARRSKMRGSSGASGGNPRCCAPTEQAAWALLRGPDTPRRDLSTLLPRSRLLRHSHKYITGILQQTAHVLDGFARRRARLGDARQICSD